MAANEIIIKLLGQYSNWDVYEPTGVTGATFTDTNVWLSQKITAGIAIRNITSSVIVCNNNGKGYAAYEETHPSGVIRTFFELT